jgi:HEAT repeat protein
VPRRPIRVSAVLWLLAQHAAWRVTGLEAAGRGIVRALSSADPTVRTMAGMLLVRAGHGATPLLREALAARQSLPMVVTLLADIGDQASRPILTELTQDPDVAVARAARQALRVLDAQGRAPAS